MLRPREWMSPSIVCALAALVGVGATQSAPSASTAQTAERPHVLVITVDTLRVDHVSAYGYERRTTPRLDRLIHAGARFDQARTIEPLTGPALVSLLTAQYPHQHGASRNGLRMRSGLASLPKALQALGYNTAAFVGNWTLRDKLCGLAEHFELYDEVLTRKRWLGLVRREANADDITAAAGSWLADHARHRSTQPFFLWVHYVEPHAPYRLHDEFLPALGLARDGTLDRKDRYDTEIAFVDASIGELLDQLDRVGLTENTILVFASDHGESLGEHDYWGHGRHLYEPTLRIPLSVTWRGRLEPRTIDAPALLIDVAPTILGLVGAPLPSTFDGFDWSGVFGGGPAPLDRPTHYQAHRGAVISQHDSDLARRSGLLEVGVIQNNVKEIYRIQNGRREIYDLAADPAELRPQADPKSDPTEGLLAWMRSVYQGLTAFDDTPPEPLDEESIEQLRSLGYVE